MKSFCALIVLAVCVVQPVLGATHTYWLAHQEEWSAKRGMCLRLENKKSDKLDDLVLVAGFGTGKTFRFLTARPHWQLNKIYTAQVRVENGMQSLWLDGEMVKQFKHATKVAANLKKISAAYAPSWANKGTAPKYNIIQHDLQIESPDTPEAKSFFVSMITPEQIQKNNLWRFNPASTKKLDFIPTQDQNYTLTARFTLVNPVAVTDLPALVDTYGQAIDADYPGKVKTDSQLKKKWQDEIKRLEKLPTSTDYDAFGGYLKAGWTAKPTGFYYTQKQDGKYWLITPQGNPCFYLGVCTVPSMTWPTTMINGRENLFENIPSRKTYASAWGKRTKYGKICNTLSFHTSNMMRKYGKDWRSIGINMAVKRLKHFGFHGIGKWGGSFGDGAKGGTVETLPFTPVLYWRVPQLVKRPDFFDPAIAKQCYESLEKTIKPHLNNPRVIGWSIGNEKFGIVWPEEIQAILKMGGEVASKRAIVDYAYSELYQKNINKIASAWKLENVESMNDLYSQKNMKLPPEDFEKVRCFYSDAYHAFAYKTVKKIDPNHLFLGYWIVPGWWVNESDWDIAAKYCDVLGFDRYSHKLVGSEHERLVNKVGKPVILGEFSFPADYQGKRGYGTFTSASASDKHAGALYAQYIKDAAVNPYFIGLLYFHYRDQPLTGRNVGKPKVSNGEHFAFGLVDVTDTPKWDQVLQMREANLKAVRWRLGLE